ncbi:MAG TPA: apolipoprotein N-acyltransferase [bacterium]|nr:apolipoprotein N-acyltransferase [bacterium]
MAYFAAFLSGLLAALSFPTIVAGHHFPDLSWLAWVALIPYLSTLEPTRLGRAAGLTFLFSFSWNALTSYWIFNALYFNGQLSVAASLGVLATMAVLLAGLQSAFIPLTLFLIRRFRLPWVLTMAGLWALYEWVRNYWPFGGYPWANLGYSQATSIHLLQSADLFGVYGLSFVLVAVNAALTEALQAWRRQRPFPKVSLAAALVLPVAFAAYGSLRLRQVEARTAGSPKLAVGLLQPNIGQRLKWKKDLNDYIQKLLLQMTRQATEQGAQFVIWPESALPTALPMGLTQFAPLSSFSVPILLGILSIEQPIGLLKPVLYNSALQVDPGGQFAGRMHKQHLVPLGEYVPLKKLLWFVKPVAAKMGDFRVIEPKELLKVDGHPYGVVICYEDLFPEIARHYTRMGAAFLVNITNDAWYGDVSQLDQHLHFSIFRAVENRRALVRGTNTGYTAAIDPSGRIRAEIPKFIAGILLAEIPLEKELSVYVRFGDGLWIGLITLGLATAGSIRGRKSAAS